MSSPLIASGPQLYRISNGAIEMPANSSNSTTTQSAFGASRGGSTRLTCEIEVSNPGDNDHAYGGVESSWAFFANSPGPGPLQLSITFGAVSLRAFGSRHNEWGWSSHEVYAGMSAFAKVLYPESRNLTSDFQHSLASFWNIDLGPQNAAKMQRQVSNGSRLENFNLNKDRWDRTLVATPLALNFRYTPSKPGVKGDLVAFTVGFRLVVQAPEVNDYDFRLSTESSAAIAWVSLVSQA